MPSALVTISPEVSAARESGKAIVALETTILSFGLPRPLNRRVADNCERAVREAGAVPATVALLDGKVRVGLDSSELDFFCSRDSSIQKVNLQNFASVLSSEVPGALTVAASMQVCALAGIRVFATGGIGGVHRGFASTLDISSDLRALSQFPVAVVCAGAKSILDVGATLEALETLGVPVVGYKTSSFPLFFASESEYVLDTHFENVAEAGRLAHAHFRLSAGGVLVVTPVPTDRAIPRATLEEWVSSALADARREGVSGKRVTPYLLEKMESLSGSATLEANHALILNNCGTAGSLAVEMVKLGQ